jgi:hypothetical protein
MFCSVTVRQLRPGRYEAFRQAWEPQKWFPGIERVMIARGEEAPDQVMTVTFLEGDPEEADRQRDDPALRTAEERRLAAISQHEETVLFRVVFEIVEELVSPGSA